MLLIAAPALANEPAPAVDIQDGLVTGRIVVQCTPEEARAALADPNQLKALNPDMIEVKSTPAGECHRLEVATRGLFRPLRYTSQRCPTATGFKDVLVESSDFTSNESEWIIRQTDAGTVVELQMRAEPNLPVPRAAVESNMRSSVSEMLSRVARRILKR